MIRTMPRTSKGRILKASILSLAVALGLTACSNDYTVSYVYMITQGVQSSTKKAEWPDWTPPPEMIARQPYLPRFMAGGPGNPLGARAMYLGTTVYRIHGTNRPDTIGTKVSSGCFRLVNADVADLYDRVPIGTKVIIRQKPEL